MTRFLAVNSMMYGGVLRLYPPDLRHSFGDDMAEAFDEDLRCAWGAQGLGGVLSVWWWTVVEFLSVGLPAHAENRAVMVPVFSFVFSVCTTLLEATLGTINAAAHGRPALPVPHGFELAGVLVGPALLTALIAFVVVRCSDRASLQSLELCQPAAISGAE